MQIWPYLNNTLFISHFHYPRNSNGNFALPKDLEEYFSVDNAYGSKRWVTSNLSSGHNLYLGGQSDIDTMIKNKQQADLTNCSAVYFSKMSNFPRYKFSELCQLKKKLNISKADITIIEERSLKSQPSGGYYSSNYKESYILYSPSINKYFCIFSWPSSFYNDVTKNDFESKCKKYGTFDLSNPKDYIKLLKLINIIPSDVIESYYGEFYVMSPSQEEYYKEIENSMKIIYDTDLDVVLSSSLPALDEAAMKNIDSMLKSSDESTMGLGIKILAAYNTLDAPFKAIKLLADAHNYSSKAWKAVGTKQLLDSLGITIDDLRCRDNIRTYKKVLDAAKGHKDAATIEGYIKEIFINEINKKFEELKAKFKHDINLTFDLS